MLSGDWLVRVLEQMQSARLAVKVLAATAVFAVLVAAEHAALLRVAQTLQVAPVVLYAAAFVVCFAFGVALVEAVLLPGRAVATRRRRGVLRRSELAEQESQLAQQRDTVKGMLPSLSVHHHSVLQSLLGQPTAEFTRTGELHYLEKAGAIALVAETGSAKGVFRLRPEVEDIVRTYYDSEAERSLTEALANLSLQEREFLELFAGPDPEEPDAPAHRTLSYECYIAGQSLISKGILAHTHTDEFSETFVIQGPALSHLHRIGIMRTVARHQLRIDLGRVSASGMGGSGAHS